ncbi:hypothetical protein CONPUDRAFT_157164 [Coniophora puteana RWD-64-598 SS2]|uniref:Uncharacterized protein n=1 Tax=Coniophora puteana (strain RWD-64-598) TaxID=741705 RepID=A0A5M3MG25_CONPW|nr:uncharacterized protein CONPUDRAFT_157164 [Coniophora puteana RWD-64-598 SS2]EIW77997.1 hypothetical protein CONPUDRAFT_157164 [Coniophora puteana RWD-64-598 SS2]
MASSEAEEFLMIVEMQLIENYSLVAAFAMMSYDYLLNLGSETVVIFLLQGLLAARVYALYQKRRLILVILVIGFLMSQAMNILTGIVAVVVVPGEIGPIRVSGVEFYEIFTTSNWVWMSPAVNSIELAYELLLGGLAIRYSMKYLPRPFWRSPWSSTRTLAEIVVRDNLVYFLMYALPLYSLDIGT